MAETNAYNFLETRVGLVIDDLTGDVNYQTCTDDVFYAKAEEQGTVFTLKGFENFIYSGELKALQDKVQHPNYLIPRFMDVYENTTQYESAVYGEERYLYVNNESEEEE